MPLIQVTSGGQRSLLKKKLQVCESQQSCLFVGDQILIFHHNLQINSLKILQCDFLDFFSYFVSHSWGIPMMKITGLSHLFKWENLHNWWLTKYFFARLYMFGLVSQVQWHSKDDFLRPISDQQSLHVTFLVTVRIAWNLGRGGTKKVPGTRYSTQWKTPQKWTVLNRTVPYHAVEKRHKILKMEISGWT